MKRWLLLVAGALVLSCGGEDPRSTGGGEADALCQESRDAGGKVTVTCGESTAEAAAGEDGGVIASQAATLLRTEAIAPGAACAAGGTRVSWGADADFSGALEDMEVESSQDICDGVAGDAGTDLTFEEEVIEPGDACAVGGLRVRIGYDEDGDQALGGAEVQAELELCTPPCPKGSYLDATLGACRPGQVVIVQGTITGTDPGYPSVQVGDPFRLAFVYDLEPSQTQPLEDLFKRSRATYQFATFRFPGGDRTWRPPTFRWDRRRGSPSVEISMTPSGLVVPDPSFGSLSLELTLGTPTWPDTSLPPSSILGTSTGGNLTITVANSESFGLRGMVTGVEAPQVLDPANLLPQDMP